MSLQMQTGLVSTVIPVFNRPDMIKDAVASVLDQTHRPIEVIVIDDGSTDHTDQVIAALANRHPEVRVFTQENAGPGAARELGRLNARGEYVQYLDSDDLLLPDKFAIQIAALQQLPAADVAYGKTERIQVGSTLSGNAMRGTGLQRNSMFPEFLRSRWWGTSTPLYRRSIVERAGPWMSTINEEDWEYDCRIASFGGRLVYVDAFVSTQRAHADHLHFGGTTDPAKLLDRCIARSKIFHHAQAYMQLADRPADISHDDWVFFSKSVFLLARECALADLPAEAHAMVQLSTQALGRENFKHRLFLKLASLVGWRRAATAVRAIGK